MRVQPRGGRTLLALATVGQLQACGALPAERYDESALRWGLSREVVQGDGFAHAVFGRGSGAHTHLLHVYLESDGTPWVRETLVAADPTPTEPIALELLRLDTAPRVLVGRPCYHGLNLAPACSSQMWTNGRYSEPVVSSMAAVIDAMTRRYDAIGVVLIGYSGGGTLAMLLAERVERAVAVVTVAGNLDIDAWARLHAYTPLDASLNPADRAPLPPAIAQLHVAGGRDRNVPVSLIATEAARQHSALLRVLELADHSCCWARAWPMILQEIEALTAR